MNVIAVSNNLYDNTSLFLKRNVVFIKEKADLFLDNLKKINPKYVFFPHWSHIIPSAIYENFQCIVFHMTNLPFGRGGSPMQNLISRGIYDTKISAISCVKELDAETYI
jgi:methionyl-tRNA formyltransferase